MLDLYRFELKKILAQKLLWILAAAILLGLAVFGVATEVRPTNSGLPMGEVIALQREGSQELAGQTVDQAFLDRLLPLFTDPEANTEAQLKYNDFFNWLTLILGTAHRQEILQTDEARLYEALWHQLAPDPQAAGLTQEEIAHWTEQAQARLAQPLVYQGYHEGWQTAAHGMEVMVFLEILFLAVVLAPLFPQEHLRRTDQLILSCRFGRGKAYAAKLLAGVTVGVGFTALLLLAYLGMLGLVYGLEGANVPALFTHLFPADLTIGEMVGILFLAALAAAVLVSVAVMLLAELTRNAIAAMAVVLGILLLTTMIYAAPENLRGLATLWYLIPSNFLCLRGAFRYPLLTLGEAAFPTWQVTPVVWLLLALVIALAGRWVYNRYQVGGR
ncbi:hypothetical protein [Evtepia sp.]|uniref:hypothetical protein n=1 Tax=Evtepia sp. TaxID=2773933 RepID=UPI003999F9FF